MAQASPAQFWTTGRWADGTATTVRLPGGDVTTSAQLICAGCHGPGAEGRREGGVDVPPIHGVALGSPRQVRGGARPAYTAETFARAVRDGVASDGRALQPGMPRYALSAAQTAMIWSFLATGPARPAPGFGDDEVRLGVWSESGDAWSVNVAAEAARWATDQPPVHGRRVRLIAVRPQDAANVRALQASDRSVAALIAPSAAIPAAVLEAFAISGALLAVPPACSQAPNISQTLRLSPDARAILGAAQPARLPARSTGTCPYADGSVAAPTTARAGAFYVAAADVTATLTPSASSASTRPACGQRSQLPWAVLAPLVDASVASSPVSTRLGLAMAPATQARLHAVAATRLLSAWMAQAGHTAPTPETWLATARSGRRWPTGVSADASWGPRTRFALEEVWLVPSCGNQPARPWFPGRAEPGGRLPPRR